MRHRRQAGWRGGRLLRCRHHRFSCSVRDSASRCMMTMSQNPSTRAQCCLRDHDVDVADCRGGRDGDRDAQVSVWVVPPGDGAGRCRGPAAGEQHSLSERSLWCCVHPRRRSRCSKSRECEARDRVSSGERRLRLYQGNQYPRGSRWCQHKQPRWLTCVAPGSAAYTRNQHNHLRQNRHVFV